MSSAKFATPRISGSMMPKHQGRKVCLLGIAQGMDNTGMSFMLKTCDQLDVRVLLSEPLNEYVGGLTEVHGEVSANNSINCQNYVLFNKEQTDSFDMEMYKSAVEVIHRFPEHYKMGVSKTD